MFSRFRFGGAQSPGAGIALQIPCIGL